MIFSPHLAAFNRILSIWAPWGLSIFEPTERPLPGGALLVGPVLFRESAAHVAAGTKRA